MPRTASTLKHKPAKPVKSRTHGHRENPKMRTFRSVLTHLDSLSNFEQAPMISYTPKNFNLARMSRVMSALGDPHKSYRTCHIAGTKGKGSTATMLAELLRGCGYRVGLYTSPHIMTVRERIVVDGKMISEPDFTRSVGEVAMACEKAKIGNPTYFETLTAAAFLYFARHQVEIAVIETGLGGRLDSTNIIKPDVVGITSISLDHTQQLGSTVAKIAEEKAGIIKTGVPVVSAPQWSDVKAVLKRVAEEHSAPIRFTGEDGIEFSYRFESAVGIGPHTRLCLNTPTSRFEHIHVPLLGDHQAINCALALSMADALKSRGVAIDEQLATQGLSKVSLPGRMEMICNKPRVLADGAHNAASVEALMRAIGQNIPYDSMVVIFGCRRDKDVAGMLKLIQLGADKIIFTSTGSARTMIPAELSARYVELCGKMAQVAEDLEEALQIARAAVTRDDLICITGSFYLVGKAKRLFANGVPPEFMK